MRRFVFIAGALAVCHVAFTLIHANFDRQVENDTLYQQIHAEEQQKEVSKIDHGIAPELIYSGKRTLPTVPGAES